MSSSTENKKIAKNTLYLYFRAFLMLVIGLYTSRVTLQVLGVEDFGIYNLVGGVVAMFSILYSTMSSASQRFITFALGENEYEKLQRTFQTSMTLHYILGVIAAILIEIVGLWLLYNKLNIPEGRYEAAEWVLHLSAFATLIKVICVPYDSLIIAHEKMSAFAFVGIYEAVMKLIIVWLLLLFSTDKLILYAFFVAVLHVSLCGIYIIYCKKHFAESKNVDFYIDKQMFGEMFSFAGWNILGNGSLLLRNQGIDILSNMFFGVTVNAAKGISRQVQSAVMVFVSNFQTAVKPQLTKAVAAKEYERVYTLIQQGSRFSFYLLAIFSVPIITSADDILNIWLVKVPDWSVIFVRLTFIYLLLDVLSRFLIHAILATGNIRNYQLMVGGIKLFALPLAYIFFCIGCDPTTGIWVNIALELVCLALRLWYNKRRLQFPVHKYLFGICLRCWIVFIMALSISYVFKHYIYDSVLINLCVSGILIIVAITALGISSSERHMIINIVIPVISRKWKKII